MEILFVTTTSKLLGLADKLVQEGHTVKLFGPVGNAFVEKVRHPYEAIKSCKFVIAEKVEQKVWDWCKAFNKPVIGWHPMTSLMNKDCFKEWQVASKLGLELPSTEVIEDVIEMYNKVLEWKSARTLIRYDRQTISCNHQKWFAWALHRLPINKKILLQQPSWGEELLVSGWFDGVRWVKPFFMKTPNEKTLKTSTILGLFNKPWLAKVMEPWEEFLKGIEYKGPFRVKLLVVKGQAQLLETFSGFECPSLYAFLEGLKEPVGEFLNKLAFSVCERLDFTTDYASSVLVGTVLREPEGAPIIGLDEGNRKHIFFGCVNKVEEDVVVAPPADWLYALSAHGQDIDKAFGRIYFTHGIVQVPESNIPTNISPLHKQWFSKLRTLEYL